MTNPRNSQPIPATPRESDILNYALQVYGLEIRALCLQYGVDIHDFAEAQFTRVAGKPVDGPVRDYSSVSVNPDDYTIRSEGHLAFVTLKPQI